MKGIITSLLCVCTILLVLTPVSLAQGFISREDRPRWGASYENFSDYNYRNYNETPTLIEAQNIGEFDEEYVNPVWHGQADPFSFDKLGNFMLPGGDIYNMTWDRSSAGANEDFDSRVNIFDNLMISSDEFSNWMTKFMIGTNMRAYFTPSTLKRTNLRGIRWDASSRKNNFTLVADVGSQNLLGAHWQSVLGDIMKLGGSFVMNQRGTTAFSNIDIAEGSNSISLNDLPRYMYVIITSDSPEDSNANAVVYEVQAVVDGQVAPIPQRALKIPKMFYVNKFSNDTFNPIDPLWGIESDESKSSLNQRFENYMHSDKSWFVTMLEDTDSRGRTEIFNQMFQKGNTTSGVKGYVNIQDFNDPADPQGRYYWDNVNPRDPSNLSPKEQFASQGYLTATGTDAIIYEFLIPAGARSVDFRARVANDYCIDVVAALPDFSQKNYGQWDAPADDYTYAAWADQFSSSEDWFPRYEWKHCAKAPGKVGDLSNTQWIDVAYDRLTGMNVYGLNAELNWRGLYVKAEFNEYNSLWAYPIHSTFKGEAQNEKTSRAWFVNFEKDFGKWSVGGEVFDYPNEYMQYFAPIDDNDDHNHTTGGYEYPGLNVNWDLALGNQHIDTYFSGQPFITYYFDSIQFGDDFNHNGIIDERENDDKIDLPYEQDSSGEHFFVKLRPYQRTMFTYGHYDIEQEYRAGRNLTDYLKFEHMRRVGNLFEYGVFHRIERVKDTYQSDQYYRQYFGGTGQFDNLAFKNSLYNTSMLKTHLTLIPNLNIINNVKYDAINRLGDLTVYGSDEQQTYKAPRDIISSTSIHKIDYTYRIADFRLVPDVFWRGIRIIREKRIREFKIMPQFKYIRSNFTGDMTMRHNGGHSYTYYPVLRFDYRVAPKTVLRFAMQGFPGMMEVNRNSVNKLNERNRRRMFFGFETLTLYQGFNLLVTSGMRRDKQEWVRSYGRPEAGDTEYFITLRVEASQ